MAPVVVSALIALAGVYLVRNGVADGMVLIGWMLLVLGVLALLGNLYLRSRGIPPPRRRRR